MKWETSVGSLIPPVFKRINQTKDGEIECFFKYFNLRSVLSIPDPDNDMSITEEWFLIKVLPIKTQENM